MNIVYILLGIIIVLLIYIIIRLGNLWFFADSTKAMTSYNQQELENIKNSIEEVNTEILSIKDMVRDVEDEVKDLKPDYSPEVLEAIEKQRNEP